MLIGWVLFKKDFSFEPRKPPWTKFEKSFNDALLRTPEEKKMVEIWVLPRREWNRGTTRL